MSDLFELTPPDGIRLFTGQRRGAFVDYLCEHFAPGESGAEAADLLLRSRIAPSKQLLAPGLGRLGHVGAAGPYRAR